MTFFKAGVLFAALSVAAGAFGAHALEQAVPAERLDTFEIAVRYQMYHALALIVLGLFRIYTKGPLFQKTGYCFIAGIVVFSGSLYTLVLTDTAWLGAITPLGGVSFLAGWTLLLLTSPRALRATQTTSSSSSKESTMLG